MKVRGGISTAGWCAAALAGAAGAWAQPLYPDVRLAGAFAPGNQNPTTGQSSNVVQAAVSGGYVLGSADVFSPSGGVVGQTYWLYELGLERLSVVGLNDALHTSSSGQRWVVGGVLGIDGMVAGSSARFHEGDECGYTAWVFNPVTGACVPVGLSGAGYMRAQDHYAFSTVVRLAGGGLAFGQSARFAASGAGAGTAAWVHGWGASEAVRLGFIDALHTRSSDGGQSSVIVDANAVGQAVGWSERYSGAAASGASAWLYDHATGQTRALGLTGGEYGAASLPQRFDSVTAINADGLVIGASQRFVGGEGMPDAWVYDSDSQTTLRLGLGGDEFTGFGGIRSSMALAISDSGYIVGTSNRYAPGVPDAGVAAWVYNHNNGQTREIGLNGEAWTGPDGTMAAIPDRVNNSGWVTGANVRFGFDVLGRNTWIYNPATDSTILTGLTDDRHTGPTGQQNSVNVALNEAGQAIGYSVRYAPGGEAGRSGWFFDPTLSQMFELVFSMRADGFAFTTLTLLTETGLVFGSYEVFSGMVHVGTNAFGWSAATGVFDVDSMMPGGPGAWGLQGLAGIDAATPDGYLIGSGALSASGSGAVVMLVPAPGAAGVLAIGLLAWRRRSRR